MKNILLPICLVAAATIASCTTGKKSAPILADAPVEQVESLVPPSDSLAREIFWKSGFCNADTICIGQNADYFTAKAQSMMKEFVKVDAYRYCEEWPEFYSSPFTRWYSYKYQIDSIAVSMHADTALVEVQLTIKYYRKDEKATAVFSLLPEGGRWRIDDFGENGLNFQKRTRWILKERRTIFRELGLKDDDRHHGIDAYFELYPDSVTWADAPDEHFTIDASPELANQIATTGLTEQRCKDLYLAIPGGCNGSIPSDSFPLYFAPKLASLLQEAFAMPTGEIDGIGYSDELSEFSGIGWESSVEKVFSVHIHPVREDSATVNVGVIYWAEEHCIMDFSMQLVLLDGQWLISAMQTDSRVTDFISFMRQYLRSEEWKKEVADYRQDIEQETDSAKQDSMRMILQKSINAVDDYFRKYPD
jgi:hypothetical protein